MGAEISISMIHFLPTVKYKATDTTKSRTPNTTKNANTLYMDVGFCSLEDLDTTEQRGPNKQLGKFSEGVLERWGGGAPAGLLWTSSRSSVYDSPIILERKCRKRSPKWKCYCKRGAGRMVESKLGLSLFIQFYPINSAVISNKDKQIDLSINKVILVSS